MRRAISIPVPSLPEGLASPCGTLLRAELKRAEQKAAWPRASPAQQAGGPRLTFPNKINLAAPSKRLRCVIFSRLTTWPACSWLLAADLNLELSVAWLREKEGAERTRHTAAEGFACVTGAWGWGGGGCRPGPESVQHLRSLQEGRPGQAVALGVF